MPKVTIIPAEYTLTLSQDELDSLRDILRQYVADPTPGPFTRSPEGRKEDVAWLVDSLWQESVWDAPWTY